MKTFNEFVENKEYQIFCEENLSEDVMEHLLNGVGEVSNLFRRGWKSVFKKNKTARDIKELAAIFKKNEKLIADVKDDFDGGTTMDIGQVIDDIVDETQGVPVFIQQQKELKKKAENLKKDTKFMKAFKIVLTNQYVKNKSIEDRLAYAWILLAGQINFKPKPLNVKPGIPINH